MKIGEEASKRKFLTLKRAFLAYKRGQYTEENLLNLFAGICDYVPTPEDVSIQEEAPL